MISKMYIIKKKFINTIISLYQYKDKMFDQCLLFAIYSMLLDFNRDEEIC